MAKAKKAVSKQRRLGLDEVRVCYLPPSSGVRPVFGKADPAQARPRGMRVIACGRAAAHYTDQPDGVTCPECRDAAGMRPLTD